MKRFFNFIIAGLAAMTLLGSCMKENEAPTNYLYGVLNVVGTAYYFTDDAGKTYYPGDVSRIRGYSTVDKEGISKDGKRIYIEFSVIGTPQQDFDYNIAVYYIYDIMSKSVEVADTEEEVTTAGDDRVTIDGSGISGSWLDIAFSAISGNDTMHKLSLIDNQTVEAPASMPDGYQYLEFRHKAEGSQVGETGRGMASFKLSDSYHPAVTGKKGLYIRMNDLNGVIKYVKVDYKAPSTIKKQNIPTPYMDRIR